MQGDSSEQGGDGSTPSALTQTLTEDGPAHFEASDSAWFGTLAIEMRNVTMSCASTSVIEQEMALILDAAGNSAPDAAAGGGAVPVWAIALLVAGAFSSFLEPP